MNTHFFQRVLDRGTFPNDPVIYKNRVRLMNLCMLLVLFFLIPIGVIVNWLNEEWSEVIIISSFCVVALVSYFLNINRRNQAAFAIVNLASITVAIVGSFLSNTQSAAPFGALAVGTISVFVFENRKWKYLFSIASVVTFAITHLYQLHFHQFDPSETYVIVLLLGFLVVGLVYAQYENHNYQVLLQAKNKRLEEQRNTIEKQANDLLRLQEEKHIQDLALKQKDIEKVISANEARDKMTENIKQQLKSVLKSNDYESGLRQVLGELSHQEVLNKKLNNVKLRIDEINSDFYHRLLKKFPDLTKSERELSAHLRLNLTNKEIATIKNSTDNSVNVAKSRLRKKMGFSTNHELTLFLLKF